MTADASSSWRLAKAERFLAAAQRALDADDWETATSRAYYAVYHAMIAVLETKEGITRATWSHNFRPYFERYTYLGELRDDLEFLYRERIAADYLDDPLDEFRAEQALLIGESIRRQLTEVLGDG